MSGGINGQVLQSGISSAPPPPTYPCKQVQAKSLPATQSEEILREKAKNGSRFPLEAEGVGGGGWNRSNDTAISVAFFFTTLDHRGRGLMEEASMNKDAKANVVIEHLKKGNSLNVGN